MAEKRFSGMNGPVESAEVAEDYEGAAVFDKLRVGDLGVYFRDGFKTRFLPFDYIHRAFIRVQEVNGKLCCGKAVFSYFRMVFVHDGKEVIDVISENEKAMDDALARIAEKGVPTGVVAPAKG